MKEGHISTTGRITKDYPNQIKAQIDRLPSDATEIIHHICSPGGDCYAAYAGYHEIMKIGKPITSIIEGEAQSMATFLAIAPANKVQILDPSTFMIHEPFFPEGVAGTVDELEAAKTELEQIRNAMAESYAKKTGKSVADMLAMMKKTTRMTAADAKNLGFVDMVVEPRRVAAEFMEEIKKDFQELKSDIMNIFKRPAPAAGPTAVDLETTDGKKLHVEYEGTDNNFVGKPATIDGQPANGPYTLKDGTTIVCAAGVVTEVKAAAPPEQNAADLQKQILDLQTQLNATKAAEEAKVKAAAEKAAADKIQADAAKAKVELEAKEKELQAVALELETLKKRTAGDGSKPNEGMTPTRTPMGYKVNDSPNAIALDLTKAFIKENMRYLHQYYPTGYFDNTPSMISILETSFSYTYPGILTTDIFYKPTLQAPALSDIFTIDQDIQFKKQYNLVTELNKIVRPFTGCGATVNTNRQLITNAEVVTKEFEVLEGWCKTDFTAQLSGIYNNLAQEWLKTGNSSFDPAGTPIDKVIMTVLKDAMQRDVFRRAFFADATSSDLDYNQFDGFLERNLDNSGASNYCVRRVFTTVGGSTAFGLTLAAGNALTYLGNAYTIADPILKDDPQAYFLVTRSIWDNYYDSLIGNGSVSVNQFVNLTDGVDGRLNGNKPLYYKGYPVIACSLLDKFLAETDNPRTGTVRHIIAFTTKRNHILGVENGADLNKIESWYEMKDQKRYYRSDFKMGYNYLHCDLTVIGV